MLPDSVRSWVPYVVLVFAVVYVGVRPDWVGACVYGLSLGAWVLVGWLDVREVRAENASLQEQIDRQRAELQKFRTRDR